MVTAKRDLRIRFKDILMAKGIDDLQLEIDLVAAVREVYGRPNELERKGTLAALETHERIAQLTVDASHYPDDVREVIQSIYAHWKIVPPSKRKKGGQYASWIEGCREIIDACAEFEVDQVLSLVNTDYASDTSTMGRPPYTITGPSSLVKMCRAKAAQLRERTITDDSRDRQTSFYF